MVGGRGGSGECSHRYDGDHDDLISITYSYTSKYFLTHFINPS